MTRMSKQGERRAKCPRRSKAPSPKTGSKQDKLPKGYRVHTNAASQEAVFIPRIQ